MSCEAGSSLAQRPERDRVAQRLDRREAVLPFAPRRAAQQIDRARLGGQGEALPTSAPDACGGSAAAPATAARCRSRRRRPAGRGASRGRRRRSYLTSKACSSASGARPGECGGAGADRMQPVRDRRRLAEAAAVEPVGPAERDGLALAEEAVKLERLERQRVEPPGQRRFLRLREEIGRVASPSGMPPGARKLS